MAQNRQMVNDEKVDDDETVLDPGPITLSITPETLPYSPATIKNYLKQAGFELECVRGYKEGRYPGYKRKYNVIRIETGKVVQRRVTLDDMRCVLARANCPLPPPPRHSGAENFLRAVAEVQNQESK